jgi:hypothetical protein
MCLLFCRTERQREAAESREKEASCTKIYNDAAQLSRTEKEK